MTTAIETEDQKNHQAIDTTVDMASTDIGAKEEVIIAEVIDLTDGLFQPQKLLWRSDYFGTGRVGAFHYLGWYKGESAVLKIQGAKPAISEVSMIEQFAAHNKSKIIRPPRLLETIPWSQERGYEVLILEFVSGAKVLPSGRLLSQSEIQTFFELYSEYKQHCVNTPWLPKPDIDFDNQFEKLLSVASQIKPDSPFKELRDIELARRAKVVLLQVWDNVDLEFQHGHFSAEDLIRQENQVVLFSNLFWKWKFPFYDAVFAYHWKMYSLASIPNITNDDIENQRKLWLEEIRRVVFSEGVSLIKDDLREKLLNAALLERAVAGLLIDSVAYIDEANPHAEHMVVATRAEVERLIGELENEV